MKRQIKKWTLRLTVSGLFIVGFLLTIILNPILTYANKTTYNNYIIYHNQKLDNSLLNQLDQATELLKTSEFFNSNLNIDICLNDGSVYPNLIHAFRGQAFIGVFITKL